MLKLHRLFYQCMRAYQDRYLAICHPLEQLRPRDIGNFVFVEFGGEFVASRARNKPDVDGTIKILRPRRWLEKFYKRLKMLFGQNLRRRHVRYLERTEVLRRWAGVYCCKRGNRGDGRLAAPDVALQEARHRVPRAHIAEYCLDGSFLSNRCLERKYAHKPGDVCMCRFDRK